MDKITRHKKLTHFFIIGILFFSIFFIWQLSSVSKIDKIFGAIDPKDEFSGWAWSSNIGWVGLNCADQNVCDALDYKVYLDTNTNKLRGYAWSNSIGWIRFDSAGPYPENPQTSAVLDLSAGKITGWARALSYGDGWDGWIKLAGTTNDGGSYGINGPDDEGKYKGYAWGSDVVGWLNFSGSAYNNVYGPGIPEIPGIKCDSFNANPSAIILPQSSTLSWSCNEYTTACAIYSDSQLIKDNLGKSGTFEVHPIQTTQYELICQGLGGPISKFAAVTVGFIPEIEEVIPR